VSAKTINADESILALIEYLSVPFILDSLPFFFSSVTINR